MDKPITVRAGEYVVIPIDKYKAPEMLEMLIKTAEHLKELPKSGHINQRILKIEQLIKQATEL